MIEQIIKLREEGLSFRKIAVELNTSVGKVQYRFNKWIQNQTDFAPSEFLEKETESSEDQPSYQILPARGVLQLTRVSHRKIAAFWEISQIPQKLIQLYFNQSFQDLVHVIRLYDVTDIIFNGKNAHQYFEIAISYDNGCWLIKGLKNERNYLAELGVYFNETSFFPILRSNPIHTSVNGLENQAINENISSVETPEWRDHVSTYSYYEQTRNLEGQNERNQIPTR